MLMLLEAWEGINLSRHVAFSKQKMIIETIPTIQGQDSHFRFAKRCWNQTTVQTFSSWLQHHKNTQKRTIFPVPLMHIQSMARYGFLPSEKDGDNLKLHNRLVDRRGGINITWCSKIIAGKDIENKLDYGITGSVGLEILTGSGNFGIEGRYYFGLGNIYGITKKDYFARCANSTISVRLTYSFTLF